MPAQHNLNIPPYNDDWDPKDNFYRVMYKPGFPIQARELNQTQSILQDQIESFSSRFMKDGDTVVPGEFSMTNPAPYVRVSTITNGSTPEEYVGYELIGVTSGVKARVTHAVGSTEDDDITFYVIYEDSGSTAEYSTFLEQETLETDTPESYTAKVGVSGISKPISSPAIGSGTLFTASQGTYYVNGFMVRNEEQIITLDKYGVEPNYKVGFIVSEEFVTSSEDVSLLDNSQGYSNFAAPGADRLKINLNLAKLELDSALPDFINLSTIENGAVVGRTDKSTKWDWLYDILAKRTHDESGDYIVTDFAVQPLEYYNLEGVDGVFDPDPDTGEYPPIPNTGMTTPLTFDAADAAYAIRVDPGLAYVQGYDVGFNNPFFVYGNKARNLNFLENSYTPITEGHNISITNVYGVPSLLNISQSTDTTAYDTLTLYRNFIDGYVGESKVDELDFQSRPLNYGLQPQKSVHIIADGDIGDLIGFNGLTKANIVYLEGNSCVITGVQYDNYRRGDFIGDATILIANVLKPRPSGVMKPRYMIPKQYVDSQVGYNNYNSTHKLGFLSSVYFTELALTHDTYSEGPDVEWEVGKLVFGLESQAFGTVEEGSEKDLLVLSNIIGQFNNGESVSQVTDTTRKVSRIMKPGEVYDLQFYTAGSSTSHASDDSIEVTAIGSTTTLEKGTHFTYDPSDNKLSITQEGRNKLYNFPYPAGSVLNERVNYKLTTNNTGAKGYAITAPSRITNTLTKTKSIFSNLTTTNLDKFSADISVQNNNDSEVYELADRSLFTGIKGQNFITCDNFSGDASDQLIANDVVTFVDDDGNSLSKLVLFATKPVGYGEERAKCTIYFTTTIPNNVTGKTAQRIRVKSRGKENEILLYDLPVNTVASLQTDNTTTRINYRVYRQFVENIVQGVPSITISTDKDNERFVTDPSKVNIAIIRNTGGSDIQGVGRTVTVSNVILNQDDNRQAQFELTAPIPSDCVVKILAPVQVTDAKAKIKLLKEKTIEIPFTAEETGDENLASFKFIPQNNIISLNTADVYKIKAITLGAEPGLSGAIDITENYTLDNGQRDNYYDIARLYLKSGRPPANDTVYVQCEYFEHTEDGDFFSVDSYTHDEGVRYGDIPKYSPSSAIPVQLANTTNTSIELRDVIDFRPIVNTAEEDPSKIATITPGISAVNSTNFKDTSNGGNGFAPRLPIPYSDFQCDLTYYLPRMDSLFIDRTGKLLLIEGNSSISPQPPAELSTGIRLYNFNLPAYTFSVNDIKVKKFNYRRYTMADIASMDRKLNNIEELVTLSILEQSALNMNVRDSVTGLDRFKNGIVVDTFRDHSKGDTGSSIYRNSIDPKNTHLRAPHFTDQITLEEKNQTDVQRQGDNYSKNNDIITVPFVSVSLAKNEFATTSVNLQPYSVFVYDGSLVITPQIDTFRDVNRVPNLVIEDNSLFNAMVDLTGELASSGIGTVWGDWETTGTNITSSTTTEVGNRSTINITETTTATTQARSQTSTRLNVSTGNVVNTSFGDRMTDIQVADTMRSIPILLNSGRLKPNTRYYLFFDNVDCTDWVSIDEMSNKFPDKKNRYIDPPNTKKKGFGNPLLTDDLGVLKGVFIVPNGRAPLPGTVFTSMSSLKYKSDGPTRSFRTGPRVIRLTTSPVNSMEERSLESYAETTFTSSGVIYDKQDTIVSTRSPSFSSSTVVTDTQSRTITSTGISDVDVVIEDPPPPPVQIPTPAPIATPIPPVARPGGWTTAAGWATMRANRRDPVAQTFLVDNLSPDGVFVTELDVFFETKDDTQSVDAYIVTTDASVPTSVIVPHSRVTKNPNTILRVSCELPVGGSSSVLKSGYSIVGTQSGATGTIKSDITFESEAANASSNVTNTVYNLVLDNYLGEFVPGEIIQSGDLVGVGALPIFTIVGDEVSITRVDMTNLGKEYTEDTVVEFSEPELPGGVTATAVVKVAPISTDDMNQYVDGQEGQAYEIELLSPGSGYTRVPTVTIVGAGGNAEAVVRTKEGTPAVTMGVCTSEDGTAATTFKFAAPVYLLGSTEYAFVLKSSTSLNYKVFTSILGQNIIGTNRRVTQQPSVGSLFKSQNGGLWTEDQTQDIKFELRRALFEVNSASLITLNNEPITKRQLNLDPIETSSFEASLTSEIFGVNPRVIKVYHYNHGFSKGDYVAIDDSIGTGGGDTLAGIPLSEINTLHKVLDVDMHTFTIMVTTPPTLTIKGGGDRVMCSYSRPYEVNNIYAGLMSFGTSQMGVTTRATQTVGLSTIDVDYLGNEIKYNEKNNYVLDSPIPTRLMESHYYSEPMQVANILNECQYNDGIHMRGEKSVVTKIRMSTFDSKTSPVLDLQRTNMTISRNLIDYPKPLSNTLGPSTKLITFDNSVDLVKGDTLSLNNITTKVGAISKDKKSIMVTTGPHVRLKSGDIQFNIDSLNEAGSSRVIDRNSVGFSPETEIVGSVFAKWVSKLFIFENPCDGLEIKLSSIYYTRDSIKVYYRPRNIGFDADVNSSPWIPFNVSQTLPNETRRVNEENKVVYPGDVEYSQTLPLYTTPGLPNNVDLIKPRSSDSVDPNIIRSDEWQSLTWSVQDVAKFDALSIKIVMTVDNPAFAPLIDDLQLVVSE